MIGMEKICARPECGKPYVKTTHNMKYCCNDCTRIATNAKIMKDYHERKAIERGKIRWCRKCQTVLSRYNKKKICASCEKAEKKDVSSTVSELVGSVTWL